MLQPPRHTHRAFPGANHHDEVGRRKLAPDHAHHAARREPEQQEEDPGIYGKENQEEAAEIQPEDIFEDDQAQDAVCALPRRIAQDHPRVSDVQFFVDFQPETHGDPGGQGEGKHQRLAFHGQVELVLQVQQHTRLISRFKRQCRQKDVG